MKFLVLRFALLLGLGRFHAHFLRSFLFLLLFLLLFDVSAPSQKLVL